MFSISDLAKLLEQLPKWKQLAAMPEELAALRKRVELLEQSQRTIPQADQCPRCRGLQFRLERSEPAPIGGELGVYNDIYRCASCGYERTQMRT